MPKFVLPTQAEVIQDFMSRGMPECWAAHEAEKYMGHYESNGWTVGRARTPMRSWHGACRLWFVNWCERQPWFNAHMEELEHQARRHTTPQQQERVIEDTARARAYQAWQAGLGPKPDFIV